MLTEMGILLKIGIMSILKQDVERIQDIIKNLTEEIIADGKSSLHLDK